MLNLGKAPLIGCLSNSKTVPKRTKQMSGIQPGWVVSKFNSQKSHQILMQSYRHSQSCQEAFDTTLCILPAPMYISLSVYEL